MKTAGVLAVVALAMACSGQEPPRQARPPAATAPAARLDFAEVAKVESGFEQKLKFLDPSDPFDRLGACSGVYVSGYGLVSPSL